MCAAGGLDDVGVHGGGTTIPDVFENRIIEQQRFLRDQGDLVPDISELSIPQVDSIKKHIAAIGIVESGKQVHQSGLTRPVRADDSYGLTCVYRQIESVEDDSAVRPIIWITGVLERDVAKFDGLREQWQKLRLGRCDD